MINTPDTYKLSQCIYSDGIISLYHACNQLHESSCIVKIPADEMSGETCESYLKNEFSVCNMIENAHLLRSHRLVKNNTSICAEFHHCDVIPFQLVLRGSKPSVHTFIDDAITMVAIVDTIHNAGVIHGNLSPAAFLKSISTGKSYLTGFYVATLFREVAKQGNSPLYYPPSCSYIAPEQTGNISRAIDQRTDLYALGAVFYEMIVGEPPFTDTTTASLMYSHVARKPMSVQEKQSDTPQPISDIIAKLLEKDPADRYQCTSGLLADLEECRRRIAAPPPASTTFTPGLKDRLPRLLPLKNIYGRDAALRQLSEAHASAAQGRATCVFIRGNAGIGKSRLVDTFLESQSNRHTLIARSKCEASSVNAPYYSLKNAISDLIRNIIAQGSHAVAIWKDLFNQALGDHRNIVADFIPELQMIIGPCSPVKHNDDSEAGMLFKKVFISFLRSIPQQGTPFVLYIDDLQWSDSALLEILTPAFFEKPDSSVLIIVAARSEHSSDALLEVIRKTPVGCSELSISTLTLHETTHSISDLLGAHPDSIHELAEVIYAKTGGNPFFLVQFVETLVSRNIISHTGKVHRSAPSKTSLHHNTWSWNKEALSALACTENVIDLILDKADLLPIETVSVLKIASCIGQHFESSIIALIANRSESSIAKDLHLAHTAGIVRYNTTDSEAPSRVNGSFNHDRIREAIYSKISEDERAQLHLRIGRTLFTLFETTPTIISTYDIVKHFNPFASVVINHDERFRLSKLNKQAALQARNAHAYQIAINNCDAAVSFLGKDGVEAHQDLYFSIEFLHAECEYLFSYFDKALDRLSELGTRNISSTQHAHIDLLRMSIYDHSSNTARSLEKGSERLREMGISIPLSPSIPEIAYYLLKAATTIRSIAHIPATRAPANEPISEDMQLVTKILCRMWLNAFILQKQGVIIIIMTQMITLTQKIGECGATPVALCFWGIFRAILFGNPLKGLAYGDKALQIAQRLDDLFSKGITYFLYGSFFAFLKGHIDSSLAILARGKQMSFDAGDFVSASNSTEGYLLFLAFSGKKLSLTREYASESITFLSEIGLASSESVIPSYVLTWVSNIEGQLQFDGPAIVAETKSHIPLLRGIIFFHSIITALLTEDYLAARSFALQLKKNPLISPNSYFYFCLVYFRALAISADPLNTRQQQKTVLVRCRKALQRAAKLSSVNFEHCLHFVDAEYYRVTGNKWDALQSYNLAITSAERHGFIYYAAVAAERAASFLQPYNLPESRQYLKKAIAHYTEWGCPVKAAKLRQTAPDLFTSLPAPGNPTVPGASEIDLQALLKAFEAISNELRLDCLLEKLIRIVMENIGAQRGVLLLEKEGKFSVCVEGTLANRQPTHDTTDEIESKAVNIPAEAYALPQSVLSFVTYSREPVRLENASEKGRFIHDEYFRKHTTKSAIAVPLLYNDRLRGIIYLENNLTEGAFPPARLQLLKMLSGQAIISIENALFHEVEIKHLQSKVNPHFIFNALSSIAELCHQDAAATEDAIIKLSTLYRYVLTSEMRMVSISEELEIVHKYLAIEKLRFGKRLSFVVNSSGDTTSARMPSMIIQPLVENSIKHGISPRPSGGTIILTTQVTATHCTLTVEDDGLGAAATTHGTGYGLESIKKRLFLHYGSSATITINDAAGYKVHIQFPLSAANTSPQMPPPAFPQ